MTPALSSKYMNTPSPLPHFHCPFPHQPHHRRPFAAGVERPIRDWKTAVVRPVAVRLLIDCPFPQEVHPRFLRLLLLPELLLLRELLRLQSSRTSSGFELRGSA